MGVILPSNWKPLNTIKVKGILIIDFKLITFVVNSFFSLNSHTFDKKWGYRPVSPSLLFLFYDYFYFIKHADMPLKYNFIKIMSAEYTNFCHIFILTFLQYANGALNFRLITRHFNLIFLFYVFKQQTYSQLLLLTYHQYGVGSRPAL